MNFCARTIVTSLAIAVGLAGSYFLGSHQSSATAPDSPGASEKLQRQMTALSIESQPQAAAQAERISPAIDAASARARQTELASFGSTELYAEFSKLPDRRLVRGILHRYSEFFRTHPLAPTQMLRVSQLVLAQEMAIRDARAAATNNGLTGPAIDQAVAAATSGYDTELAQLLTPEQLQDLRDAPKISMFTSSIAASVGVDLDLAGTPLTPEQTRQLAVIWEAVQNPRTNPGVYEQNSRGRNQATGMTALHEAIVAQATKVLSPEQLAGLKTFFADTDTPTTGFTHIVRD